MREVITRLIKWLFTFATLYFLGLLSLFLLKYIKGYPSYVIPSPEKLSLAFTSSVSKYFLTTMETFLVAIIAYSISVIFAFICGCTVVLSKKLGPIIQTAVYTLQAYPIVATAPIFFIIIGSGYTTRLIITATICYFPMLLTIVGVLSTPVPEVEHFFSISKKLGNTEIIKIRLSENTKTIITSLSGSAMLSVLGAILAEFLAADVGIGYVIRKALYQNKLEAILVALFIIGVINWAYLSILELLAYLITKYLLHITNNTKERNHVTEKRSI